MENKIFADRAEFYVYLDMWQKYAVAKGIDDIPRAGFEVCGTGRWQPTRRWTRWMKRRLVASARWTLRALGEVRQETAGGHTFGLALLADIFYWYRPSLMSERSWRILWQGAISYHEADELGCGEDKLDDGTQDTEEKARCMQEAVKNLFRGVPNSEDVQRAIVLAETMKGVPYEQIARMDDVAVAAWWLKAFDKTEAVLQNGRYRLVNAVGRISLKPDPSARDLRTVEALGTDDIVFVWAWNSAGYVRDTVLWKLILAMVQDVYAHVPHEIPEQFRLPGL